MGLRLPLEAALLVLAWGATLAVRPWRLLRAPAGAAPLVTPWLASLTLLPWLWAWPGLAAMPVPLHWSGAPLVVLLVGWPLAVPCITLAGFSTMLTTGASAPEALALTVWAGLVPATLALAFGHAVRKACGAHPVAYLFGRAFLVPFLVLAACGLRAAFGAGLAGSPRETECVVAALLAMGEASWTCAVTSLLVAWRPQWLATWSDALYLPRPARAKAVR